MWRINAKIYSLHEIESLLEHWGLTNVTKILYNKQKGGLAMDVNFRDIRFAMEEKFLSPYACKSKDTKGRAIPLTDDSTLRTEFIRDRDRILHCKSFRRLKHKTQVFLSPEGDHYRTRLTHTLEVSQIARTISRALGLNEDLTEAIALGHDLGHTPFGHAGERALDSFIRFEHNEQSLRVVDKIEYNFKGMNLTHEVRDGILHHKKNGTPSTLEGKVVSFADRIAYLNHDIDDAIRAGIISESDLPKEFTEVLGSCHGHRINNMIMDIVNTSYGKPEVTQGKVFGEITDGLRNFMFANIYTKSEAKSEEGKAVDMVKYLYEYYLKHLERIPAGFHNLDGSDEQHVCDYIATFSDRFAIATFESLFVPKAWHKL